MSEHDPDDTDCWLPIIGPDATFLAQCREAGYDAAKCRLFLTDPGE